MFEINKTIWLLKFVSSTDSMLQRKDGSFALGMCDGNLKTIFINDSLRGRKLKKLLCHEMTHAAMFSYGVELSLEQEEIVADLIATYGEEIIHITNQLFYKLKNERP